MLTTLYKRFRHYQRVYGTLNNGVILVALIVAASWVWGSISVMQTNFSAQKMVDEQKRQLELTQLQVDTLKYQQNYYNSDEYKDLAARQDLGLVSPGEKVLILPPNSATAQQQDKLDAKREVASAQTSEPTSNFEQWLEFFNGRAARGLQN
jgi:cell division protein FtsB